MRALNRLCLDTDSCAYRATSAPESHELPEPDVPHYDTELANIPNGETVHDEENKAVDYEDDQLLQHPLLFAPTRSWYIRILNSTGDTFY